LGGLITYLLLAIYCRQQHGEPVSINRVRELRFKIANEAAELLHIRNQRAGKSYKVKLLRRAHHSAKT
ncbi:MAG TPA: IS4 family transposase, partial [Geobacter sp.]|nr:IS4 family transposase [Geobacter sp.]